MNRTLRHGRRAAPVLSLAILSVVATGGSAQAAGTCPDGTVAATVNITGTEVPGCRAIYRPDQAGKFNGYGVDARVLLIGGGGGGSSKINLGISDPYDEGGSGGGGGELVTKVAKLACGVSYTVTPGRGGGGAPIVPNPAPVTTYGRGGAGQDTRISDLGGRYPGEDLVALGGGGGYKSPYTAFLDGGRPTDSATLEPISQGGRGNTAGGGGGGGLGGDGTDASGDPYTVAPRTGGDGGLGIAISAALFPGLGLTRVGGGGGGFGSAAGGIGRDGGGNGGSKGAAWTNATSGLDDTGSGGGGGAQEGNLNVTPPVPIVGSQAGDGGDGIIVIDFPVPTSTSCTGGSGSGGGSGGGSAARTVKAGKPKVAAAGTAINVSVTAPGAGTALLTGSAAGAPKRAVCTARKSFTGTGTARMTCVPGAGVQRLRRVKAVRVKLVVAFRPSAGGATQTLSVGTVTLPKVAIGPIPVTG